MYRESYSRLNFYPACSSLSTCKGLQYTSSVIMQRSLLVVFVYVYITYKYTCAHARPGYRLLSERQLSSCRSIVNMPVPSD